jgi:cell division protease FtsH
VVSKPDLKGRFEILKVHARKVPLHQEVDLEKIARGTPGFAGADLENLVNEAALNAARLNRDLVFNEDFEAAKDKVSMGSPRRSMVITDEEKRATAYHEAGHALVGRLVAGNDPVHKVTIIPHGPAMGVTMTLPKEDSYTLSKSKAEALISFLMGGRLAEEIVLGQFTTGASNDIERATELARRMVTEWGMSEKLGPLNFGGKNDSVFLGREFAQSKHLSEDTAKMIDEEIRSIVDRNYARAREVLTDNLGKLHVMAKALLDYETIETEDIDKILAGEPVVKMLTPKPNTEVKSASDSSSVAKTDGASVIDLSKPVKA